MRVDPYSRFVQALKSRGLLVSERDGKGTARCPAHDDRHASLSFCRGDDGKLLVKCHAGCEFGDIMHALGLEQTDAFIENLNGNAHHNSTVNIKNKTKRKKVAEYIYRDEHGIEQARKVRFSDKSFSWIRNGKWGLNDWKPPLYNLHLLYQDKDSPVLMVEGEKDADTLTRLGFLAVSPPNGASINQVLIK
ncbi:MAG TPA: toprim domain-containing protein [Bacteroidetes bacterium]|nr:toprim domain-containing protein [Bacteroidota bacterium]HEX05475.1 toprim domain-containing protein [Bacteroidota bacterium]